MAIVQTELFSTSFNNPVDCVLEFLTVLPKHLGEIYTHSGFHSVWQSQSKFDIEYSLFMDAFNEARQELQTEVVKLRASMSDVEMAQQNRAAFEERLRQIGFTGASLQLKAQLLNWLYARWRITGHSVENFMEMMSPLRAFLKYLNKVLESLSVVVPGLHAIKEIKDASEAGMDNGEFVSE